MRKELIALIVSGTAVAAVVIFLGRIWADAYFSAFSVPVDDVALDASDYAFRTREVTIMLLATAALSGLLYWGCYKHKVPWRLLIVVFVTSGFVLLGLYALFNAWSDDAGSHNWQLWSVIAIFPLAFALAAGAALVTTKEHPLFVLFAIPLALVALFVPLSVELFGRIAAHETVAHNSGIRQAILEFDDEAPLPIRRGDDPARSTRVYLLLLTDERVGIAFPLSCSLTGAELGSNGALDRPPCDSMVFDHDDIRSIKIFGRGGRPSNVSADSAEEFAAPDAAASEQSIIYDERFDFERVEAAGDAVCSSATSDEPRALYFKVTADQAGRLAVSTMGQPEVTLFVAEPLDSDNCIALADGQSVSLSSGEDVLIVATSAEPSGESSWVRLIAEFTPRVIDTSDCFLAALQEPATAAPECNIDMKTEQSVRFSVAEPSTASITVETEPTVGDGAQNEDEARVEDGAQNEDEARVEDGAQNEDDVARVDVDCAEAEIAVPTVVLSDTKLTDPRCLLREDKAGYDVTYQPDLALAAAPDWPLLICANEVKDTSIRGVRIQLTPTQAPTPLQPEETEIDTSPDDQPPATAALQEDEANPLLAPAATPQTSCAIVMESQAE